MKQLVFTAICYVLIIACGNNDSNNEQANSADLKILAQMKDMVQKYPDSASFRMLYINALDSLQRYPEALAQTDSMIGRDSQNNGLWFARGQLLESINDTAAAITSYEKALSIYPSVEAKLNLANLYAEKQDPRALAICQTVSQMSLGRETDANCDFIAGVYNARSGNAPKAISFFDRAINNNYTLMEAYMEKGFIYYDEKKFTEAIKTFETAITISNTYADAYYWKAKTLEIMGKKPEALTAYEQALGLDKQLAEARKAIDRLK